MKFTAALEITLHRGLYSHIDYHVCLYTPRALASNGVSVLSCV